MKSSKTSGKTTKRNTKNQPKKTNHVKKSSSNSAARTNFSNTSAYDFGSKMGSGDSFFVRKSEFVQNIQPLNGPNFNVQKFEFNPGLVTLFPWLSSVAPSFQKYRIKHVSFEYKTAQSTFAPGMVMFAPSFDVNAELPKTKSELLEYAFAKRGPVWKDFSLHLSEKDVMSYKSYYVRTSEKDEKLLYDPMYFLVATDSISSDLEYVGELWISYDIDLIAPVRLDPEVIEQTEYAQWGCSSVKASQLFLNSSKIGGSLPIELYNPTTLRWKAAFDGLIHLIINHSNAGNSVCTGVTTNLVSDVGQVQTTYLVEGSGTGGSGSYTSVLLSFENVEAGDSLSLSIAYSSITSTQILNGTYLLVIKTAEIFGPQLLLKEGLELEMNEKK